IVLTVIWLTERHVVLVHGHLEPKSWIDAGSTRVKDVQCVVRLCTAVLELICCKTQAEAIYRLPQKIGPDTLIVYLTCLATGDNALHITVPPIIGEGELRLQCICNRQIHVEA